MTSGGGTEVQTIMPPEPPGSKRKVNDDGVLAGPSNKKPRKASQPPTRKLNGERIQGGLVIVREASTQPSSQSLSSSSKPTSLPSSSKPLPSHPTQTKPRSNSRPAPTQPTGPPPKKPRTDSTPLPPPISSIPRTPSRPRTPAPPLYDEYTAPVAGGGDADADIVAMNTEADLLRSQTRSRPGTAASSQSSTSSAGGSTHPEFALPTRTPTRPPSGTQGDAARGRRGKRRDEEPPGSVRRRASMSARGKRVSSSYDTSGIITQPHPSVPHTSFYKHVDSDLPEPQRARQLLIWCASRAMDSSSGKDPPATGRASTPSTPSKTTLPPLDTDGMGLLRGVQAQLVRMLAQKKIDTNVFAGEGTPGPAGQRKSLGPAKRENAQNVENRAREVAFKRDIERAQAEEQTWVKAGQFYDTLRASIVTDADRRLASVASERARGKMRADSACADGAWASPHVKDLPLGLGGEAVSLARRVLEGGGSSGVEERIGELAYRIDVLHARVHEQLHRTHRAQESIDARFAALSIASRRLPAAASPSFGATPVLPPAPDKPAVPDARSLLRALARIDSQRAPDEVSEAVRRARREVQRADEAAAAGSAQPLSQPLASGTVPPQTPRKGGAGVPATPSRRAGTPGRRALTPGIAR